MNENTPVKNNAAKSRKITSYYLVFLFVALCVLFSILSPTFLTVQNWSSMLIGQVTVGCMALGAISILILNEFDLSLGYMISFCMTLGAALAGAGAGAGVVIPVMIIAGGLFGLINGILSVKFHVSSFIATLGIGMLLYGLTLAVSGGNVLSSNIPDLVLTLGQGKLFEVGYSVWILILLGIVMLFVLNYTTFGRQLYAIGGSERVAFLAGVKTNKVKIIAFVLAGVFTGIGSVFQLGQTGSANPSFGSSLLMPAYAIVFLSANAFQVGTYNIKGLLLAIILLAVGRNGITMLGIATWAEYVYNGGVLILSVFITNRSMRKRMASLKI